MKLLSHRELFFVSIWIKAQHFCLFVYLFTPTKVHKVHEHYKKQRTYFGMHLYYINFVRNGRFETRVGDKFVQV